VLLSWPIEPSVSVPVLLTGALYLRGWRALRRRMPERFDARRGAAFTAGLVVVLLAVAAPLDALAHRRLSAHMVQHLLLMMVAPPLLWMGAPVAPLVVALPRRIRGAVVSGLSRPSLARMARWTLHPGVAWVAFALSFWFWHAPALYDLALRSDLWHHAEHVCFVASALLFWRPVIRPWPARTPWPRWAMIPYLLLAALQSMPLAAILTFADRIVYTAYAAYDAGQGVVALDDQALAGVIMWVPGSLPLLLPVLWLTLELSSPPGAAQSACKRS